MANKRTGTSKRPTTPGGLLGLPNVGAPTCDGPFGILGLAGIDPEAHAKAREAQDMWRAFCDRDPPTTGH